MACEFENQRWLFSMAIGEILIGRLPCATLSIKRIYCIAILRSLSTCGATDLPNFESFQFCSEGLGLGLGRPTKEVFVSSTYVETFLYRPQLGRPTDVKRLFGCGPACSFQIQALPPQPHMPLNKPLGFLQDHRLKNKSVWVATKNRQRQVVALVKECRQTLWVSIEV